MNDFFELHKKVCKSNQTVSLRIKILETLFFSLFLNKISKPNKYLILYW